MNSGKEPQPSLSKTREGSPLAAAVTNNKEGVVQEVTLWQLFST